MQLATPETPKTSHIIGAIYDTKAELFWQPQLFRSKADFIRALQMGAKDKTTMLHQFPADYDLMVVGEWDETSAIMSNNLSRLGSVLDLCPLN